MDQLGFSILMERPTARPQPVIRHARKRPRTLPFVGGRRARRRASDLLRA